MANRNWIGITDGDYGTATNWSTAVPVATDNVRIPAAATQAITGSLDQSAVAIGDFIVERGYAKTIAASTVVTPTYLQIDPDRFEFSGKGVSYIDLGSAAIDALIKDTAAGTTGKRGLYLKGSAIAELSVEAGSVGLGFHFQETSSVTTARVVGSSADLVLGEGVTNTAVSVEKGKATVRCPSSTLDCHSGTLTTEEKATGSVVNVHGGTFVGNSATTAASGTFSTINQYGGTVDMTGDARSKTVTAYNYFGGVLKYNPDVVTITTLTFNAPVQISLA